MENFNIKGFKTKIEEIKHIGDELFFQFDYYNYKHKNNKIKFDRYSNDNNICILSAKKYTEITGNQLEYTNLDEEGFYKNFSYDIFYNLKKNNIVKKRYEQRNNEVKTLDNYYIHIICMFKVLDYLDDYDIFRILKQYNIKPKNDEMKKIADELKEKCRAEYIQKDNTLFFDLSRETLDVFLSDEELEELKNLIFQENTIFFSKKEILEKAFLKPRVHLMFSSFNKYVLEKLEKLIDLERKCLSLECKKNTSFISEFINNKINYISYESLLRMLECLNLSNSDLYFFTKIKIKHNNLHPPIQHKLLNVYEDI